MPNLYTNLSKLRFLKKNYSLKFLFIAFIGIHIPLIIIVIISSTKIFSFDQNYILLATLVAATAGTLYFLNKLLWPLREAKNALSDYLSTRKIPNLPVQFEDEAGVLLKELQQTIEQLDYLMGEKKDVITILSHDIRTPFNQVLGLSSMILLETDRAAINNHAQTMKEISIKNLMVLNDILNLLKTDYSHETENTSVELNDMITIVCHHLMPTSRSKSITFNIQNSEPLFVLANKVLLTEAVSNVVNNAIKFSYPGGVIDICIERKQGIASVEIKDNGIGISDEDKSRIFKRFTSAGKQGTAGEYSSGVGLYLSRKIIVRNKGHLNVSSEGKDKGSIFTITLPVENQ
jgi:signal transduction histidine kinase